MHFCGDMLHDIPQWILALWPSFQPFAVQCLVLARRVFGRKPTMLGELRKADARTQAACMDMVRDRAVPTYFMSGPRRGDRGES